MSRWRSGAALAAVLALLAPRPAEAQQYREPDFDCRAAKVQAARVAAAHEKHRPLRQPSVVAIDDSVFLPMAGVPYDSISFEHRLELAEDLTRCLRNEGPALVGVASHIGVGLRTSDRRAWQYQQVLKNLETARNAWRIVGEVREGFRSGSRQQGDAAAREFRRVAYALERNFWPDVVAELTELDLQHRRGAFAADNAASLTQRLDQVLRTDPDARPWSVRDLLAFVLALDPGHPQVGTEWIPMPEERLQAIDPAIVESVRTRARAHFDEVYPRLLERARAVMSSTSTEPDDVMLSSYFGFLLLEFQDRFAWTTPAQSELLEFYRRNQPLRIATAREALVAGVDTASTVEVLRNYVSRLTRAPGDVDIPALRPVLERAEARVPAFRLADGLRWSQERQRAYERAGHQPSADRGPDEIDLFFALEEWFHTTVNLPYRLLGDVTAWATSDDSPLRAWPIRVELGECQRQSQTRARCHIRYGIETNFRETAGRTDGNSVLIEIWRRFARVGNDEHRTLAFEGGRWKIEQ